MYILRTHAQPERILVTNVVAEPCIGNGSRFVDPGEIPPKGFERPARVHAAH